LQILAAVNGSCRFLQKSTAVAESGNSLQLEGMHQLFCFLEEKQNDIAFIGKVLFYANIIVMLCELYHEKNDVIQVCKNDVHK
jgi:hypothetical protein